MPEKRNREGLTEAEFLAQYRPDTCDRPSVMVDMLLLRLSDQLNSLKVLLIQRDDHPFIGQFALPGGSLQIQESAYDAACRELKKKTGLENIYLEQLYTFTQPDRDPRMRVIDIAYMGIIPMFSDYTLQTDDDMVHAFWFDVSMNDTSLILTHKELGIRIAYELQEQDFVNGNLTMRGKKIIPTGTPRLAFDHAQMIYEGLSKLRKNLMTSDIAFGFMSSDFTLPDLQRAYEVLLGKPLYKKTFRSQLAPKVIATEETREPIGSNRPAVVYRQQR